MEQENGSYSIIMFNNGEIKLNIENKSVFKFSVISLFRYMEQCSNMCFLNTFVMSTGKEDVLIKLKERFNFAEDDIEKYKILFDNSNYDNCAILRISYKDDFIIDLFNSLIVLNKIKVVYSLEEKNKR